MRAAVLLADDDTAAYAVTQRSTTGAGARNSPPSARTTYLAECVASDMLSRHKFAAPCIRAGVGHAQRIYTRKFMRMPWDEIFVAMAPQCYD
jgi:hypothetical protein